MTDEQIGRHKGAVETLLHEKKELSRLLQIVNSQLERHLGALEEAGIDTDSFIENLQQEQQQKAEQVQKQQGGQQQRQGNERKQRSQQQSRQRKQQEQKVEGEDEIDDFLDDEEDEVPDDFSPI